MMTYSKYQEEYRKSAPTFEKVILTKPWSVMHFDTGEGWCILSDWISFTEKRKGKDFKSKFKFHIMNNITQKLAEHLVEAHNKSLEKGNLVI